MKLNNVLSEIVKVEYSSDKGFEMVDSDSKDFHGMENSIANDIKKAFETSEKFKEKFKIRDSVYDVEVEKKGPNLKIQLKPEDGDKVSVGTFPMSVISKYLKNPSGLAKFLLMNYR